MEVQVLSRAPTMNIKLFDPSLPIPAYLTSGAVGFDLYARIDMTIPPWKPVIIPLNIAVEIPQGYMLMLAARSSTADKFGLILANGVGIIDRDYRGDADELGLKVLNFTKKKVIIKKGERVGQGILVKVSQAKFKRVKKMKSRNRGGWGSTGHT